MENFTVIEQREEVQIGFIGRVGNLNGLSRIDRCLRQSGPAVVDVNLFAVDRKARLGGIFQASTLTVTTLEGDVSNVNNIAARLFEQGRSDRLIPPSSIHTVIL